MLPAGYSATEIAAAASSDAAEAPSRTFRLDRDRKAFAEMTDGYDAVVQAIYLILNTERYQYLIYGWDYGIETLDLIGQPANFVQSELKRRIREALLWDDRILSVDDFVFSVKGKSVSCTFTVETVFGGVEAQKEVQI